MLNTEDYKMTTEIVRDASLSSASGYIDLTTEAGWGIGIKNPNKYPLPAPGDSIDMYWEKSDGWGGSIAGASANGYDYFYKTRQEIEDEYQAWRKQYADEKQKAYDDNLKNWIHRRDQLVEPLRKRIHRFEQKDGFETFWKDSGQYELFILEQAQILYLWAIQFDDPIKEIDDWNDLEDFQKKYELVPGIDDGHSGWTWGGMIATAKALIKGKRV